MNRIWGGEPQCCAAGKIKRDKSKDSERAIDQPPPERDSAEGTEHECVGNQKETGDHPEFDDPDVAHGIAHGSNESDRDGKVAEGKPVRAIEKEMIARIGIQHGSVNRLEPFADFSAKDIPRMNRAMKETDFRDEGNGCRAAHDETEDNDGKPKANPAKSVSAFGVVHSTHAD